MSREQSAWERIKEFIEDFRNWDRKQQSRQRPHGMPALVCWFAFGEGWLFAFGEGNLFAFGET